MSDREKVILIISAVVAIILSVLKLILTKKWR
jgi:hypothetical protein